VERLGRDGEETEIPKGFTKMTPLNQLQQPQQQQQQDRLINW